jgi:hypothetical protein
MCNIFPFFNLKIDFCKLKIQFIELDFYNLIFQKSSTDQQGVRVDKERISIGFIVYGDGRVAKLSPTFDFPLMLLKNYLGF